MTGKKTNIFKKGYIDKKKLYKYYFFRNKKELKWFKIIINEIS